MKFDILIERLEAATGPDRELDCRIETIMLTRKTEGRFTVVGPPTYDIPRFFFNPDISVDWIGYDLLNTSKHYTSSIDAALTLVPEDMVCAVGQNVNDKLWIARVGKFFEGTSVSYSSGRKEISAPIALCIAAMKARNV